MSVLARSMQLLELLEASSAPMNLTKLREATGLPLTTVHRLCAEMLTEGMIERDVDGGYGIGARLWVLGRRFERAERFRTSAARFLRDLHEVTRSQVDLVLLVGEELIVVERLTMDPAAARWHARAERLAAEHSAAGLAIAVAGRRPAPVTAEARAIIDEARATGIIRLRAPDGRGRVLAMPLSTRDLDGAVVLHLPDEDAARTAGPSLMVTTRRIRAALEGPVYEAPRRAAGAR